MCVHWRYWHTPPLHPSDHQLLLSSAWLNVWIVLSFLSRLSAFKPRCDGCPLKVAHQCSKNRLLFLKLVISCLEKKFRNSKQKTWDYQKTLCCCPRKPHLLPYGCSWKEAYHMASSVVWLLPKKSAVFQKFSSANTEKAGLQLFTLLTSCKTTSVCCLIGDYLSLNRGLSTSWHLKWIRLNSHTQPWKSFYLPRYLNLSSENYSSNIWTLVDWGVQRLCVQESFQLYIFIFRNCEA